MTDKEKLVKYINQLEIYLSHLKKLQKYPREKFLANWEIYDLADRKLHLVIENVLNIGEMIISEFGFRKPDRYSEIPQILSENKVIPKKLEKSLVDLAKFRNVLVHEYVNLDHKKVYQKLKKTPKIIEEFIQVIKEYVKSK